MPASLLPEMTEQNRELFGDWLSRGGPVPQSVLERLDPTRRAAFENLDLGRDESAAPGVPATLLGELEAEHCPPAAGRPGQDEREAGRKAPHYLVEKRNSAGTHLPSTPVGARGRMPRILQVDRWLGRMA